MMEVIFYTWIISGFLVFMSAIHNRPGTVFRFWEPMDWFLAALIIVGWPAMLFNKNLKR